MTNDAPFLLDVTRLIWRRWKGRLPTGIDRVCLAYMRHFADRSHAVVQHDRFRRILDREASNRLFEILASPANFRLKFPLAMIRHSQGLDCNGNHRLYLNIGHTGLDAPRFRDWVATADVRPVYLVHDLIPITHPEFCRAGEADRHRDRMRTVLKTATGVIGNSQATLDELASFASAEDLANPPSLAAWLGTDALPTPETIRPPERPTFVVIGTIEARKNHMMLLDIWSRLAARFGSEAPRLLIIGQRGWEADDVFAMLDQNTQLRNHVVELSRCSDAEIARHLAEARALLFPSMVEGYGLPLLEALGMSVPVIASDLPVFREIGSNLPTYLNPADTAAWESAILDYARPNSEARAAQLSRIRGFRAPSWDRHFAAVEAWLPTLG